ncbi:DEAD/DEAH box helicase [Verrucomicrobiales bacterium BCK34]|nr:DEAD/DEAH box helicase [Verrucomicrobiales bacterium BCK34]
MKADEIKKIFSEPEGIEKDAFGILQGIAGYVNNPDTEELGRDLVLRALEHRKRFGELSEILDGLTREVGLFPYLAPEDLNLRDTIAFEFHKPNHESEFVFHRVQAEVYRRLMGGENVILSAPTSFGKSRIIDAVIASGRYNNLAIIVPTIALIDETRRRLSSFSSRFKVVSQLSQSPGKRNLFVFTAERLNAYEKLPKIDFFVIDEFYKIGAMGVDGSDRMVALNQAFYRLAKERGQFYLLGPSIRAIPEGLETKLPCYFIPTKFATVASDVINVFEWDDELAKLVEICGALHQPTLIFCRSPKRVNEVAKALIGAGIGTGSGEMSEAAEWTGEHFHEDWVYAHAIERGIGLHHGRLPRSLGQLSVHSFNAGKLQFLICTSTLIEGVNTCAKNVIVFDHVINRQKFDFFTFNNIKGRSGRMFEHFVGRVFLFHPPPEEELPFVDFPSVTQDSDVPDSLLVQIDSEDLSEESKERLREIYNQNFLPVEIIRQNSTLDPLAQIALAEEISSFSRAVASKLWWSSMPKYDELKFAVGLLWKFFIQRTKGGVFSANQLTFKIWNLRQNPDVKSRVLAELKPGQYQAESADEAVERVLNFDRNWAGFEFPRLLMSLWRIQAHVLEAKFGRSGNYSFFAARVEQLFRNPALVALEEYGLPLQVGEKVGRHIELSEDLDTAITQIRDVIATECDLNAFEAELLRDVQETI